MKRTLSLIILTIMVFTLVTGCTQPAAPAPAPAAPAETPAAPAEPVAYKPSRSVEFVVPYGAGGGSDLYARIASDIMQKGDLVGQPVMVVNKPGGAGAVGDAYTFTKSGSGEVITTYVSAQITGPLMNNTEVTYKDLTPIANLAMDEYTLGVLSSAPFTTLEAYLAEAGKAPKTITVGGSGKGTEDELVTGLLAKHAGVEFEYVSFNSSAEVMSAMLGGHIDSGIFNPNECISQVNAGEVTLLAAFGPERISMLPDLKTFKEQGLEEVVFQQFRGIFGPPEMPEGAVEFWADVFEKVTSSDQWKTEYLAANGLTAKYMTGEEYNTFLDGEAAKYEDILRSVGAID
jgi:putative tricarboxylic transport membrane protein